MTTDSAAPGDTWQRQLTRAFEALLGRPLSSYDATATYAAYLRGNWFIEAEFDMADAWTRPAALIGRETVDLEGMQLYYEGEVPLRFDASESWYELGDTDDGPATTADDMPDLPADAARDLLAACLPTSVFTLIRGRDLAAVLDRHHVAMANVNWRMAFPRIASDGTLLDAMRVATGIGDGPES